MTPHDTDKTVAQVVRHLGILNPSYVVHRADDHDSLRDGDPVASVEVDAILEVYPVIDRWAIDILVDDSDPSVGLFGWAPEEHSTHDSLPEAIAEIGRLLVDEHVSRSLEAEGEEMMAAEAEGEEMMAAELDTFIHFGIGSFLARNRNWLSLAAWAELSKSGVCACPPCQSKSEDYLILVGGDDDATGLYDDGPFCPPCEKAGCEGDATCCVGEQDSHAVFTTESIICRGGCGCTIHPDAPDGLCQQCNAPTNGMEPR